MDQPWFVVSAYLVCPEKRYIKLLLLLFHIAILEKFVTS